MYRADDTGFGGIRVIQIKGQGYGVDAVLLASFAAGDTGGEGLRDGGGARLRIADLGTGCGVAAFILHHKLGGAVITGYDVNGEIIEKARAACRLNGLEKDVDFICCDVRNIKRGPDFDAVITNPPYFRRTPDEPGAADPDGRYIARHETTSDIKDFMLASARMLKQGGSLYMVHRPDRLPDIFVAMRGAGIEPKHMQLVLPQQGKPANIVLIHGIKGAGPELRMMPAIAVREADGSYTRALMRCYEREA